MTLDAVKKAADASQVSSFHGGLVKFYIARPGLLTFHPGLRARRIFVTFLSVLLSLYNPPTLLIIISLLSLYNPPTLLIINE